MPQNRENQKMNNNSILPVIAELEKIYLFFLPKFGKDLSSIPMPRILIQSTGKKQAFGWYSPNRWRHRIDNDKLVHEITITAEYLEKGPEEAAHTVLHEMCHYTNYIKGVKDCNSSGYHNIQFRKQAEFVGLKVDKVHLKGWAITSLTDKLKEEIKDISINEEVFNIFRLRDSVGKEEENKNKKEKIYKCHCTRIKSSSFVFATCNNCGEDFEEVVKIRLI